MGSSVKAIGCIVGLLLMILLMPSEADTAEGAPVGAAFSCEPSPTQDVLPAVVGPMTGTQAALPALRRGLASPDVQVRRNVVLFLNVAANPVSMVQPCLPELITALHDSDARVRALAAQAIGEIRPMAVSAVPGLVLLLADPDEGSRNSACILLAGIGPAARDALPALRRALSDASPDVRRFAQRAIDRIDVR
jgi:HEAT repeat protein